MKKVAVAKVITMSCVFKVWLRKYYFGVGAYWDLDNKDRPIVLKFLHNIDTMRPDFLEESFEADLKISCPRKVVKQFLKCVIIEPDD